jgi:glycerol-3-phosphate dehydrogenase
MPLPAHTAGSFDVAIIGGGVTGCALARELSRYRLRVVLLEAEAEVGFGVSKSNSGIIHSGHQSDASHLKGRFEVRGNELIGLQAAELGFGFRRIGALIVARNRDEMAGLEDLRRQGEAKGVPGLEIWDAARLRQEEPNLAPTLAGALLSPTTAVINPYEYCFALAESAARNGVEVRTASPVQSITPGDDGLVLGTPAGPVHTRFALNCAGLFSDDVAALAGVPDFRIRPRKGEEYLLDRRLEGIVRHIVYPLPTAHTKGTLIIPTFDGTIMVGPTADDLDDKHDLATSAAGSEQIFRAVRELCPAIRAEDTIAEFAGLRPAADGGDFVIGPTRVPGFVNVAGIQSPGLTAAPAIAEYVCDLLRSEGLRLDARDDFGPTLPAPIRFAALSWEEQQHVAQADPLHARLVCRCELVTEAEIHAAIDRGARTLDGLKFRTRAGMGRCQGGFCTTPCMEALADRLGVPITEVTKRGGGSWLVVPRQDAAGDE